MTKVFKITGRTIGVLLEWTIILVILFAFVIRTSPVQTYLGQKVAAYFSKELGTTVSIDHISILFFDEAALEGLLILDKKHDTLFHAKTLYTTFDELSWREKKYNLGALEAEQATIYIRRDTSGNMNFAFIKDYFAGDKVLKKKKSTFKLREAILTGTTFKYDDDAKVRKEFGIDYGHILCSNINAKIEDFNFKHDTIRGRIARISADETSGFHLSDLKAIAKISSRGIELSDVQILTKSSQIKASRFNLLTNSYSDFKFFVDSVNFDGGIQTSTVDLKDVAYFAPILKGMVDTVLVSGRVNNKVTNLQLNDLEIRYQTNTRIKGDFNLNDYRNFTKGIFREWLEYAYIDLNEIQQLRLPDSSTDKYLNLDKRVRNLGFLETKDVFLYGTTNDFVIAANEIKTELGSVVLDNGLEFIKDDRTGIYAFHHSETSEYDVHIKELQLGRLIGNNDIGVIDGSFLLSGSIPAANNIIFDTIRGEVNKFEYLDYAYKGIRISEGMYKDQKFEGKVDVEDDNLNLTYDGYIDFKGRQEMVFTIELEKAILDQLNLAKRESSLKSEKFQSKITVNINGKKTSDMAGSITLSGLIYKVEDDKGKTRDIPLENVTISVVRGPENDVFTIKSVFADVTLTGKVDFERIAEDFQYQFSRIFPSLMKEQKIRKRKHEPDHFDYNITIKQPDGFLEVFVPDLEIEAGTVIKGHYDGKSYNFNMDINSPVIVYKGIKFDNVQLIQVVDSNSLMANYHTDRVIYNDSITFSDVFFKTNGGLDELAHELSWEGKTTTPSHIGWHTSLNDWMDYSFHLEPSYFYLKDHRWDIAHESRLNMKGDTIEVDYFELTREKQLLMIDGRISRNRNDHLNFRISEFEIEEIAEFISSKYELEGKLNGWGYLSDPFYNLEYIGDAALIDFKVNKESVGDIFMQSEWDRDKNSISAMGDLIYQGNQTFDFDGHYYLDRKDDNLDFDLIFDYTDIQFVNAFLDPDVMSEVRGILIGSVQLSGTPERPVLSGSVNLAGGSTYIDLLGVHFGIDGPIEVDEYGFYMNNIPVFDEEGNAGYLVGSIYHENFRDFNFDLQFDLERDAINRDPIYSWKVVPLEKFLMLDAAYRPDYLYYGKGYATGMVNIFGYTDNLEITVDVSTVKGTDISIPMYGVGELEAENDFIIFDDSLSRALAEELPKFNFTGVSLDLNFHVTDDADLRIVFDEDLGDEITANGYGDISIKLDNLGDVRMDGLFTIDRGEYNFAMQVTRNAAAIKQRFFIEKGGTIGWTGDPYDANLNLATYYKVNANISDISQDIISSGSSLQPIQCYLNLTESLLKPTVGFDIRAPQANDIARQLVARVTSDKDELNRQFFSLLLFKRFQPIGGKIQGGSGTAIVENQINSLLSAVSSEYKMNVNIGSDKLTGEKQYEFGVTKGFLDDRLILSGSFGVETFQSESADNQNSLIGDINLEYLLNESGTFRIDVFNESTDKTVIQQNDHGRFTQGAGITYKEDFNDFRDFKAVQYFLDVFRKKENKRYPIKRKKEQRPVPTVGPAVRIEFRDERTEHWT